MKFYMVDALNKYLAWKSYGSRINKSHSGDKKTITVIYAVLIALYNNDNFVSYKTKWLFINHNFSVTVVPNGRLLIRIYQGVSK